LTHSITQTYILFIIVLSTTIFEARDLGPRLITYYYGWGTASLQGYEVYIIGPLLGAPIGAIIADGILY
jgi:glycerol uptake facilitator-like aquaporin